MKKIAISGLALAMLLVPTTFALAQDYPSPAVNPPYTWAPGAADAPMHSTHDKARAVRELNANGIPGELQRYYRMR